MEYTLKEKEAVQMVDRMVKIISEIAKTGDVSYSTYREALNIQTELKR